MLKGKKVAIVGSGPSAMYNARNLSKLSSGELSVDVYEKSSYPFGLVRNAVAPDHQPMRQNQNELNKILQDFPNIRMHTGVEIGKDISVSELRSDYDAIVFAYGAVKPKTMGFPGESHPNVINAIEYVYWYNGVTSDPPLPLDKIKEVAVIGVGNVALDVARLMIKPTYEFCDSELSLDAAPLMMKSTVDKVHLVGRRDPLGSNFTTKELRDVLSITGVDVHISAPDSYEFPSKQEIKKLPRIDKRKMMVFDKIYKKPKIDNIEVPDTVEYSIPEGARDVTEDRIARGRKVFSEALEVYKATKHPKELEFNFFNSPSSFEIQDGVLKGVNCDITFLDENRKLKMTGEQVMVPCDAAVLAIGTQGVCIDETLEPYFEGGRFTNKEGAIVDRDGNTVPGLYCSGWIRRGAIGTIVRNIEDASQVAEAVVEYLKKL